ncbi:MAG: alpha-amylase family glycosyl hydrolase, partial [Bacteroidota bacterium]
MTRLIVLLLIVMSMQDCADPQPIYHSFADYPVYDNTDLGFTYTPSATTFKLWSPAVEAARVNVYDSGASEESPQVLTMEEQDYAWTVVYEGDIEGKYYTFQVKKDGEWLPEAADPYARAAGTNGLRSQVVDLAKTNPEGWDRDQKVDLAHPMDIVLYELHVRDLGQHPSSGVQNKGKFLGLTETGTKNQAGLTTGLDHLQELGVTHIHLLPSFDFMSVDESRLDEPQFNWGYDPDNYNVPEGSYATDPNDGRTRIREFKEMVKALHSAGLRVVMDVVYNHTGRTEDHKFNLLCPGYYYRQNA